MKKCFKCGDKKPVTEFYRHPGMKGGVLGKCKECTRRDVRENRKKRIEYYREYDRRRGSRQTKEEQIRWRMENPEKYIAHTVVSNAIRDGVLKKAKACERCNADGLLHAHHEDYSKPLSVTWLCVPCHHERHREMDESP